VLYPFGTPKAVAKASLRHPPIVGTLPLDQYGFPVVGPTFCSVVEVKADQLPPEGFASRTTPALHTLDVSGTNFVFWGRPLAVTCFESSELLDDWAY
jgi:hypothetical protein